MVKQSGFALGGCDKDAIALRPPRRIFADNLLCGHPRHRRFKH